MNYGEQAPHGQALDEFEIERPGLQEITPEKIPNEPHPEIKHIGDPKDFDEDVFIEEQEKKDRQRDGNR